MSELKIEIDSLKNYSSKLNESYNNLIAIMSSIDKLNKNNQEMGDSKTINLFKDVMVQEMEKETNSLKNDRDTLNNAFVKEVIPMYQETYNKSEESVN